MKKRQAKKIVANSSILCGHEFTGDGWECEFVVQAYSRNKSGLAREAFSKTMMDNFCWIFNNIDIEEGIVERIKVK